MSGVEHKALAGFFLGSPYLLSIPFAIWLVYAVKVINFNRQQLTRPENQFLLHVVFLSRPEKFVCFAAVIFSQLIPAMLYAAFLLMMALAIPGWNMAIICAMILAVWFFCMAMTTKQFHHPHAEKRISFLKRLIDFGYTKPIVQFYIEWLLRRDPIMVVGIKIFNGVLIFGICRLYHSVNYDWRLITMATTACAIANLVILFQLQNF